MHKLTETEWIWRDGKKKFHRVGGGARSRLSALDAFGSAAFEGMRCYATPKGRPSSGCAIT